MAPRPLTSGSGHRPGVLALGAAAAVVMADTATFLCGPLGSLRAATRRPATVANDLRLRSSPELRATTESMGPAAPMALLAALSLLVSRPSSRARQGLTARRFWNGEKEQTEEPAELTEAAKANIAKLEAEIAEFKALAEEKKAAHERLKVETDNFRARTRNELAAARGKAAIPLVKDLLPVADEFELAAKNLKVETESQKAIQQKFSALFDKLLGAWKQLGFEKLSALGEEFNPELHEAVSMIPSAEYTADKVCAELRGGWALKTGSDNVQVLRPSLVCVSAGPGPA